MQDKQQPTHAIGKEGGGNVAHAIAILCLISSPLVYGVLKHSHVTEYGLYALACLIFGISLLRGLAGYFAETTRNDKKHGSLLQNLQLSAPAQGFRAALGGALGGLFCGLPGGLIVRWLGGAPVVGTIIGILSASDAGLAICRIAHTKFSFRLWVLYRIALVFNGLVLGLSLGRDLLEWILVWALLGAFVGFIVGYYSGLKGQRIPILWGTPLKL